MDKYESVGHDIGTLATETPVVQTITRAYWSSHRQLRNMEIISYIKTLDGAQAVVSRGEKLRFQDAALGRRVTARGSVYRLVRILGLTTVQRGHSLLASVPTAAERWLTVTYELRISKKSITRLPSALRALDPAVRVIAAAGLSEDDSRTGESALQRAAVADVHPAVRDAAAWALGTRQSKSAPLSVEPDPLTLGRGRPAGWIR